MNPFSTVSQPLETIAEISARTKTIGAIETISMRTLSRIDEKQEREMVIRNMANNLAYEMLKAGVIDRSLKESTNQIDPTAMEYHAELVVMARDDWRALTNAVAQIAREKKMVRHDI